VEVLFATITLFTKLTKINNFDNGEREGKKNGNDHRAGKEVFMACLVRVSHAILEFGAFEEVGEAFDLFPGTVSNLWHSTLKMVPGYEAKAPIDPSFVVANVLQYLLLLLRPNSKMLEESHSLQE
jgi:hypothetical protein